MATSVDEAAREFMEALNVREVGRAATFYTQDALFVPAQHQALSGRPAIHNFFAGWMNNGFHTLTLVQTTVSRSGNLAYALGQYVLVFRGADGSTREETGHLLLVYRFQPNGVCQAVMHEHHRDPPPHLFDEWKECRTSIDRFDKIGADLRKYGFTLITGLLTADAFLFVKAPSTSSTLSSATDVPVSAVQSLAGWTLILLIFALFMVDRSYHAFLRATVSRATTLEHDLGLHLTQDISAIGRHVMTWALGLYITFIGVASVLAGWGGCWPWSTVVPFLVGAGCTGVYHWWTKRHTPP